MINEDRFERSDAKLEDVDGTECVRMSASGEVEMLASRPRLEESERRDLKAA